VGFHPGVPVIAFLRLVHVLIAIALLVLRQRRGGNPRRVDDGLLPVLRDDVLALDVRVVEEAVSRARCHIQGRLHAARSRNFQIYILEMRSMRSA